MAPHPSRVLGELPLLAASFLVALSVSCRSAERPGRTPETAVREPTDGLSVPERSPPDAAVRKDRGSSKLGTVLRLDGAIHDALCWLVRHQNEDGSWGAAMSRSHCPEDAPCFPSWMKSRESYDEGLTGLVLLGFLRAGFGPDSEESLVDPVRAERHRMSDVVGSGLRWLLARQKPDGSFTQARAFLYSEAIATTVLVEAYDLMKDPALQEPAQRAVGFLQAAQRPHPGGTGLWGWRYASRQDVELRGARGNEAFEKELYDADTSITAWCLLALARARDAGLQVDQRSIDGAMAFCEFASTDDGRVGYLDRRSAGATVTGPFDDQFVYHPTTLSALGMCVRLFGTGKLDDPFLELAAQRIVEDLPTVSEDEGSVDYYYWHAGTLALHRFDGPTRPGRTGRYWGPWQTQLLASVLATQDHTEGGCSNGGWIENDRWGSYSGAGPLYATALNVLTLEEGNR